MGIQKGGPEGVPGFVYTQNKWLNMVVSLGNAEFAPIYTHITSFSSTVSSLNKIK